MAISNFEDDSIWQLAIQTYYPNLVNYLYFTTRDRFLAEDIAQEAFAASIDKFDQLKNPDKFLPWITSIALNIAKTLVKRGKRVTPVEDIDSCIKFFPGDDFPIEMVDRKEMQIVVQNAIAKLSPQEQNVVIMRYYLDMKDKDIAQALGVTVGTVKKVLFRAKAKLYKDLQHLAGKEGEQNDK
ncbi:MAG: RNA polymerase sigma factor [Bacillota bacterium]|nr:RNA polymerase sigma factor [Bacillota bacterium]